METAAAERGLDTNPDKARGIGPLGEIRDVVFIALGIFSAAFGLKAFYCPTPLSMVGQPVFPC